MRILLVDDHELFREGLKLLLDKLTPDVCFLDTETCEAALSQYPPDGFDLILLDLHLPGGLSGISGLQAMREHFTTSRVVALSGEDHSVNVRAIINGGAAGFIPKSSSHDVLIAALRLVLAGDVYLPTAVLGDYQGAKKTNLTADSDNPLEQLSTRQGEVLALVVQGKANKIIAKELDISAATVKAHLSAAFRALGVQNRTEAVFALAQAGHAPAASLTHAK